MTLSDSSLGRTGLMAPWIRQYESLYAGLKGTHCLHGEYRSQCSGRARETVLITGPNRRKSTERRHKLLGPSRG